MKTVCKECRSADRRIKYNESPVNTLFDTRIVTSTGTVQNKRINISTDTSTGSSKDTFTELSTVTVKKQQINISAETAAVTTTYTSTCMSTRTSSHVIEDANTVTL